MKGNKLLMIVDQQNDFITGSLPVKGAEEAMNSLAEYLHRSAYEYVHIIVTADRHPFNHCSFKPNGGEWQLHCVEDSVGAAIFPAVMDELISYSDKVTILHKGEKSDREEYSIFKNEDASREIFEIIESKHIEQVDICGIAGDICVAATIQDGIRCLGETKFHILNRFTASIDGGETLEELSHYLTERFV